MALRNDIKSFKLLLGGLFIFLTLFLKLISRGINYPDRNLSFSF